MNPTASPFEELIIEMFGQFFAAPEHENVSDVMFSFSYPLKEYGGAPRAIFPFQRS
jgi:hypothetical protein